MKALSPIRSILSGIAVASALGAGGAHAADPPAKSHPGAPAKAETKAPTHKPANKPMMLKPGQPKKVHKPSDKMPIASATPHKMKMGKSSAKSATKNKATPAKPKARRVARSTHAVRWAYKGAGGPKNWGKLKPAYKICSEGRNQSPINIEIAEAASLSPLRVHYKVSLIQMVNNGHTVQAKYGKGSYITIGDERYELQHFQFRTPSEHRIAGRHFPMEIQFVHRNRRGQLAVLGVLATYGDYNLAARELWDRLPARAHTKSADTRALINARDLLPENAAYFRYTGSLTTPPCTENVKWMVLQTPVRFSESQIAKLHRIIGENARPAQPRNSRYLLQSAGR